MAWRMPASKLTVVAETMDEDKTGFGRALGLAHGVSIALERALEACCKGAAGRRTFHVFVYSFLPSSTVCQPSTVDILRSSLCNGVLVRDTKYPRVCKYVEGCGPSEVDLRSCRCS
jgi:hypothetical protein